MGKKDNDQDRNGFALPGSLTSDLRGRQSVRATFKLSTGCIDAISIVATHLGIKQKSLFDHLAEDLETLSAIAREVQDINIRAANRVQKTFVISRKSLHSLEMISKNYNAPRDALVEFSVQRLLPIIESERKKHQARKEFFSHITAHLRAGEQLMKKAGISLGEDDPVFTKMETFMTHYKNAYQEIDAFIERGKIIESFEAQLLKDMENK